MSLHFKDRVEAGRCLARELKRYARRGDVLVLALPRGGVPVAAEVARGLQAPLDVFVVRKLGVPMCEELAMGAIGSGGVLVLNEEVVRQLSIPQSTIEAVTAEEDAELHRRERSYRGSRPPLDVVGRTVILIDDGLATGASMRVAVRAVRQLNPVTVVVAVPVGASETCRKLQAEADEVVCLRMPPDFHAVGAWYEDFSQITDEEVRALLEAEDYERK